MMMTKDPMPQFEITSGQSILKEEVEKMIQSMKKGKATGSERDINRNVKSTR